MSYTYGTFPPDITLTPEISPASARRVRSVILIPGHFNVVFSNSDVLMDGNGIQVNTVGDANLTAPPPDWLMAHPVRLLLVGGYAICVPSPASTQKAAS